MKVRFFTIFLMGMVLRVLQAQVIMTANIPAELAPGSNQTIEVKINKGTISNFSKYQIDVPANVTLSESDSKTGNFSFENSRAKIVWVSIPVEAEFTVSFKMEVGNSASGNGNFVQKFYFLDNGTKKEVEGTVYNVAFNANAVSAPIANTSEPIKTVPAVPEPVKTVPEPNTPVTPVIAKAPEPVAIQPEPVKSTPEPAAPTPVKPNSMPAPAKPDPVVQTTPTPASGQVFKVQIGAYNSSPPKSKYAAAGKALVSNEDGLYKVLIGNFSTREEALQKRDALKASGINGFVVAYQNGQRVK